jgi:hypothetical protein
MDASQDRRKRILVSVTSSPRPGTTPGASSLNIERLNWYIPKPPVQAAVPHWKSSFRPRNAHYVKFALSR